MCTKEVKWGFLSSSAYPFKVAQYTSINSRMHIMVLHRRWWYCCMSLSHLLYWSFVYTLNHDDSNIFSESDHILHLNHNYYYCIRNPWSRELRILKLLDFRRVCNAITTLGQRPNSIVESRYSKFSKFLMGHHPYLWKFIYVQKCKQILRRKLLPNFSY